MAKGYHPNTHPDAIKLGNTMGGNWAGMVHAGKIIKGEAKSVGTPADGPGLAIAALLLWAGVMFWFWADDGPIK